MNNSLSIDLETYKEMYEEVCKERDGWISEYQSAQSKLNEEQYQNTLLAQKCSDLADELKEFKEPSKWKAKHNNLEARMRIERDAAIYDQDNWGHGTLVLAYKAGAVAQLKNADMWHEAFKELSKSHIDQANRLRVYEEQWEPSKQEHIDSFSEKFDTLADEYQELVKFSTMIFRGIPRFELTALMSSDQFEKFKNHLGV